MPISGQSVDGGDALAIPAAARIDRSRLELQKIAGRLRGEVAIQAGGALGRSSTALANSAQVEVEMLRVELQAAKVALKAAKADADSQKEMERLGDRPLKLLLEDARRRADSAEIELGQVREALAKERRAGFTSEAQEMLDRLLERDRTIASLTLQLADLASAPPETHAELQRLRSELLAAQQKSDLAVEVARREAQSLSLELQEARHAAKLAKDSSRHWEDLAQLDDGRNTSVQQTLRTELREATRRADAAERRVEAEIYKARKDVSENHQVLGEEQWAETRTLRSELIASRRGGELLKLQLAQVEEELAETSEQWRTSTNDVRSLRRQCETLNGQLVDLKQGATDELDMMREIEELRENLRHAVWKADQAEARQNKLGAGDSQEVVRLRGQLAEAELQVDDLKAQLSGPERAHCFCCFCTGDSSPSARKAGGTSQTDLSQVLHLRAELRAVQRRAEAAEAELTAARRGTGSAQLASGGHSEVQELSRRLVEKDRKLAILTAQLAAAHGDWADSIEDLHHRYLSQQQSGRRTPGEMQGTYRPNASADPFVSARASTGRSPRRARADEL